MARDYLPRGGDSSWPVALAAFALISFIFGLTRTGQQLRDEFLEHWTQRPSTRLPVAARSRPDVLLIGARPADQLHVALTVEPRGYNLLVAETVTAGLVKLREQAPRIAVIVIDSGLTDSQSIMDLARTLSPAARVISFRPTHTTTDFTSLLLRSIDD